MSELLTSAKALYPTLKEIKDDLHRHPELAFEERRTTDIIRRRLTGLGIELIDLGMETGAVGFLRCGRPGPTVALQMCIRDRQYTYQCAQSPGR